MVENDLKRIVDKLNNLKTRINKIEREENNLDNLSLFDQQEEDYYQTKYNILSNKLRSKNYEINDLRSRLNNINQFEEEKYQQNINYFKEILNDLKTMQKEDWEFQIEIFKEIQENILNFLKKGIKTNYKKEYSNEEIKKIWNKIAIIDKNFNQLKNVDNFDTIIENELEIQNKFKNMLNNLQKNLSIKLHKKFPLEEKTNTYYKISKPTNEIIKNIDEELEILNKFIKKNKI